MLEYVKHPTRKVVVIFGPTASGKTGWSLFLAEQFNGVIINADSRQQYKDLPVLTCSPSIQEKLIAPHLLFNFLPKHQELDAIEWTLKAWTAIDQVMVTGKLPIVVGGSGFYLNILANGFQNFPSIPESVKKIVSEMSATEIKDILLSYQITPKDPYRNQRMLLKKLAGIDEQNTPWQKRLDLEFIWLVLDPLKANLQTNITNRTKQILDQTIHEVANLSEAADFNPQDPIWNCIGARECLAFLRNHNKKDLWEKFITKTNQYSKRQKTWLKHQIKDPFIIAPQPLYDKVFLNSLQKKLS